MNRPNILTSLQNKLFHEMFWFIPTRITGGSSVRLCVRGSRQVGFNPMQLHLKYVATLPCNLLLIACFLIMFHKVVWQGVVGLLITTVLQITEESSSEKSIRMCLTELWPRSCGLTFRPNLYVWLFLIPQQQLNRLRCRLDEAEGRLLR